MEFTTLNKKDLILQTAFQLFIKNGVQNTRIVDITEQCGIGKGTFYDYFKSKEDVLQEVFETCIVQSYEALPKQLEAPGLTAREKLQTFIRFESELSDMMGNAKDQLDFLFSHQEVLKSEALCASARKFARLRFSLIFQIFEEGIASGEFRPLDPLQATTTFMGALLFYNGFSRDLLPLDHSNYYKKVISPEESKAEFLDLLLHGLLNEA